VKMFQAVVVRDQSLKQALIERFGDDKETIAKINAAFDVGRERWTGELGHVWRRGRCGGA